MHSLAITTVSAERPAEKQLLLLAGTVLCAPLWWILGLNLFVYHVAAFVVFMGMVIAASCDNRLVSVPAIAWFPAMIGGFFLFSVLLRLPDHTLTRALAATYNVSFWAMGAMLIVGVSERFSRRRIAKCLDVFACLAAMNAIIVFFALAASWLGAETLIIATPLHWLSGVLGDPTLVNYSVNVRLLVPDWFLSQATPRLNLYSPYPTAAGGFFMITLPLLVTWAAYNRKTVSFTFWFLLAANLVGFAMTLSRTSIIACVFSCSLVYLVQRKYWGLWLLALMIVLVLMAPLAHQFIVAVITAREGSSLSRGALYLHSVEQLQGVDWLIGRGIRSISDTFDMPVGSHSTYVSMLYKTGLFGFVAFVLFQGALILRWYRTQQHAQTRREDVLAWRAFGVIFIGMALWMLTEDIDAPQLLAFLYFGAIGAFEGFRKDLVAQPRTTSWNRHGQTTL